MNHGVLIFADFVVHLNHEKNTQRNTIFLLIVACKKSWKIPKGYIEEEQTTQLMFETTNPWITAFCRITKIGDNEIKVLSQYILLPTFFMNIQNFKFDNKRC